MEKTRITLPDGRYLIYYRFEKNAGIHESEAGTQHSDEITNDEITNEIIRSDDVGV